jgi:hypothetical protein
MLIGYHIAENYFSTSDFMITFPTATIVHAEAKLEHRATHRIAMLSMAWKRANLGD